LDGHQLIADLVHHWGAGLRILALHYDTCIHLYKHTMHVCMFEQKFICMCIGTYIQIHAYTRAGDDFIKACGIFEKYVTERFPTAA